MSKVIQDKPNRHKFYGLYAITPVRTGDSALYQYAEQVLAGGAQVLQYRDKVSSLPDRLRRAQTLAQLCRAHRALLIINDDMALAQACPGSGVHLGRTDDSVGNARRQLGDAAVIGASCYNDLQRAQRAAEAGADYLAFGSIYPSTSKPDARPCTLQTVREARRFGLPVVAIGGITLENAPAVLTAGADMLAVIGDLANAVDPALRAQCYSQLWN